MNVQHRKTLPAFSALAGLTLGFSAVFPAGADSFVDAASMRYSRAFHTATLLRNGKVLVAGGVGGLPGTPPQSVEYLTSAEIYDPVTDTWARTGALNVRRAWTTSVLLADGKVMIVGGQEHGRDASGIINSAEIYDPTTGSWRLIRPMTHTRYNPRATLLPSGEVLVTGGGAGDSAGGAPELYDPATGSWREIDRGWDGDKFNRFQTKVLPNGKVFGGGSLYDPDTETWTRIAPPDHSVESGGMLLSGEVLAEESFVVGDFGNHELIQKASLYDFKTGSWTPTGSMIHPRNLSRATLLPDGRVLAVAGISRGNPGHSTSEWYDPTRGQWRLGPSTNVERYRPTATLLHNGTVLVVGGASIAATNGHTAELFVPDYRETAPSLNFLHRSNRILSFSWQGVGTLEQSNNLTDWEVAPLQDNPHIIATGNAPTSFFRVNAGE